MKWGVRYGILRRMAVVKMSCNFGCQVLYGSREGLHSKLY